MSTPDKCSCASPVHDCTFADNCRVVPKPKGGRAGGGMEDMAHEEELLKLRTLSLQDAPYSAHYQKVKPEPIEVIESWGLGFHLGNAVKYIARAPYKGTKKQDLEKAIFYLQRELDRL